MQVINDGYDNFKKKVKMDTNTLNDTEDEETKEDGSSTEESISGPIKLVGGYRRRSRLNLMKKENSTNLQKYSGMAEQMIKMSQGCPEITKMILDIIY